MKRLLTLVLVAVMLCGAVPFASAVYKDNEPMSWAGWEDWSPTLFQVAESTNPNVRLLCPVDGATADEVYYYVGKALSENPNETRRITMQFPQSQWTKDYGDAWSMAQTGFIRNKNWFISGAYIKLETWFADGILYVAMESAAEPDRELAAKVAEVGSAARAASDTVRGQLDYINRYLCDTVEYAGEGEPSAHNSARSALIEGYAYCNGFTSVVAALCDYLGIPNVNVSNFGLTASNVSHIWNTVYVDGEWLHLDVTWNSGSVTAINVSAEEIAQLNEWKRTFFFLREKLDSSDGVHVYDAEAIAAQQATVLKGWEGITAPYRTPDTASYLTERSILRGDQDGNLNLNAGLTRAELATILTRINGAEDMLLAERDRYAALCTFTDVPEWARPYVGYCAERGLVTGYNTATYGATDPVTPAAACTVILRHMGYAETDWNYNSAIAKAASLGLVSPYWPTGSVALRADMAQLAYTAIAN